jgi:deoxyribonuclease V
MLDASGSSVLEASLGDAAWVERGRVFQRDHHLQLPKAASPSGDHGQPPRGMLCSMRRWPATAIALVAEQRALAESAPQPWFWTSTAVVGGCFVCFERELAGAGRAGDRGWAAASADSQAVVITGAAGDRYRIGLLALREGALLEAAVRAMPRIPDVLLVDATGRDHPRRAGLALELGTVLEVPTVGVTHRTLLADGEWPDDQRGAVSRLTIDSEVVGFWVRTARGRRPLAVHAAWRTDPETAVAVVLSSTSGVRTPEPLRRARMAARSARAGANGV